MGKRLPWFNITVPEWMQEIAYAEHHVHNLERWFGISADQSGNNWATRGTLTPFQATSGVGDWGDWIKVLGSDDTPVTAKMLTFDFHRILVSNVGALTPYIFQFSIDAESICTEFMYISSTDNPSKAGGGPMSIRTMVYPAGTPIWCRVKCATADSVDFFVGLHEYDI